MSDFAPRFAVVGHPNKGKSSIVSTLAQDDSVRIGREPGTTVHCREFPMRVDGKVLYTLIDTPGFQRARRALAWMKANETTAAEHADVVRRFVEDHQPKREFPDECELLRPIVEGAAVLYVVDGSVPYGPEYEAEMEILRWAGRPSMALINPIGSADYVEPWRNALGQYFNTVRVFNAMMAEFPKRIELLRAFGQLREEWRKPLNEAADVLERDRKRRRDEAARHIAEAVAQIIQYHVVKQVPPEASPEDYREDLEREYKTGVRRLEQRCRERVEEVYGQYEIKRNERGLELLDEDLFSEDTWRVFGLSRNQLVVAGAGSGALVGGMLDATVGGASFMLGAVLGGITGAAAAWWSAGKLVDVKVFGQSLAGKKLMAGPSRNVNLPHVVFARARLHHELVSTRTHANRSDLELDDHDQAGQEAISDAQRKQLTRLFAAIRKGRDDRAREHLELAIRQMLEEADRLD